MAKIYDPPSKIKQPSLDFENIKNYHAESEKYIEELKAFVLKRKSGKNVGEIIRFQVADGYAQYMVASMKPLELVHIPLYDAWHFNYAHRLTTKDVQEKIDQQNRINELFSRKK